MKRRVVGVQRLEVRGLQDGDGAHAVGVSGADDRAPVGLVIRMSVVFVWRRAQQMLGNQRK